MTAWLLVLVFAAAGGPTGHVYAKFTDEAKCEALAAQFNAQQRAKRTAVCVAFHSQVVVPGEKS